MEVEQSLQLLQLSFNLIMTKGWPALVKCPGNLLSIQAKIDEVTIVLYLYKLPELPISYPGGQAEVTFQLTTS